MARPEMQPSALRQMYDCKVAIWKHLGRVFFFCIFDAMGRDKKFNRRHNLVWCIVEFRELYIS